MNIFIDILVPMNYQAVQENINIQINSQGIIQALDFIPQDLNMNKTEYLLAMPGFINNHVHLAYAHPPQEPQENKQLQWMRELIFSSRGNSPTDNTNILKNNIQTVINTGTTCVVENTPPWESNIKELIHSPLKGLIAYELYGLEYNQELFEANIKKLESLEAKVPNNNWEFILAPHAIYTVCPELLTQIYKYSKQYNKLIALHLAEFSFEPELTRLGHSPDILQEHHEVFNIKNKPSLSLNNIKNSSPLEYLDKLNILDNNYLLTHMIELSEYDYKLLNKYTPAIISCPRSNKYLKNKQANLQKLKNTNCNISLATDGLSSNYSLNLLDELKEIYNRPGNNISAQELLESITSIPAKQINRLKTQGNIDTNKSADLIIFKLSPQEYQDLKNNPNIYEYILKNITSNNISQVLINGINYKK